jgi:hypothetical protein
MKASEKEKKGKQKEKRNQLLPGPISTVCSPTNLNHVPISAVGSAAAARPFLHRRAGPNRQPDFARAKSTHWRWFVGPIRQIPLQARANRSGLTAEIRARGSRCCSARTSLLPIRPARTAMGCWWDPPSIWQRVVRPGKRIGPPPPP